VGLMKIIMEIIMEIIIMEIIIMEIIIMEIIIMEILERAAAQGCLCYGPDPNKLK
jgi:hypothetical protein